MLGKRKSARHAKTCPFKSQYMTQEVAEFALTRMIATGRGGDASKFKTYRCLNCGHWHFGHDLKQGGA